MHVAHEVIESSDYSQVMTCSTLDGLAGRHLSFKCEIFQKGYGQRAMLSQSTMHHGTCIAMHSVPLGLCSGAFKFRGAVNSILSLTPDQAQYGVVVHSSGNHAGAVALAAKIVDVPAYIVVPQDAPLASC